MPPTLEPAIGAIGIVAILFLLSRFLYQRAVQPKHDRQAIACKYWILYMLLVHDRLFQHEIGELVRIPTRSQEYLTQLIGLHNDGFVDMVEEPGIPPKPSASYYYCITDQGLRALATTQAAIILWAVQRFLPTLRS